VRPAVLAALALLVTPRVALACATCIASPFGDRTYNWAHLGLLALPFALVAVVVGVFVYHAGYRPRELARRLASRFAAKDPRVIKETT
jgi:hypothetical protein